MAVSPVGSNAAVISPDWPGDTTGCQIALRSSLEDYVAAYKRVFYIVPAEVQRRPPEEIPNVVWLHILYLRGPRWYRALKSLFSRYPATAQFFNSRTLIKNLVGVWKNLCVDPADTDVIYEDLGAVVIHHCWGHSVGFAQSILRSHNVLSECFEGIGAGIGLKGLFWWIEKARIRRYEAQAIRDVDRWYGITNRDIAEYFRRYHREADGCLGIRFDRALLESRKEAIRSRSPNPKHLIHLGTLDLRKTHGMRKFIQGSFRRLRSDYPDVCLILGGRNTERFNNPSSGVYGLGFVPDEAEFMGRGSIFVNTQLVGSGVKLKSLIALSYGKTVVSTRKGMEGIDVESNRHCVIVEHVDEMYEAISEFFAAPERITKIASNAPAVVIDGYSSVTPTGS